MDAELEAAIKRGTVYRARALALLKQAAHHRRVARVRGIGNEALDVAVNMVTREKAQRIAAEAERDALAAAGQYAIATIEQAQAEHGTLAELLSRVAQAEQRAGELAALLEDATREQFERDCAAMCPYCRGEIIPDYTVGPATFIRIVAGEHIWGHRIVTPQGEFTDDCQAMRLHADAALARSAGGPRG